MASDPFNPFNSFPNGPNSLPGASVEEIFVKRPPRAGRIGGRAPARPAGEVASEALEDGVGEGGAGVVPDPAPETKPEIRLFNPQWGGKQGVFNEKMAVTVEGALPPESSHLTRVTFTVHALLPDGKKDRIGAQEGHLQDGKAAAEVTLWAPDCRDAGGKLLEACEYIFTAKHRDGKEVESPRLPAKLVRDKVHRVRLSGMLFDANKCFPLPDILAGIKSIVAAHGKYPAAEVLLVGHAGSDEDLAGSDIAFERALMLCAYLKSSPNPWLNQFGPEVKARSRWGTRELQLMLSALPEGGPSYYSGTASGVTDDATTAALKAFQEASGLPADGKGDFATRKALIEAYMALGGTTLAADVTPIAHGVEGTAGVSGAAGAAGAAGTAGASGDAGAALDPRRFEVFLFEKGIVPRPEATTSEGSSGPYAKWVENVVDTEDFESHGIHVQIVDAKKVPVPFAKVTLTGPVSAQAECDAHGFVSFKGLKPGEYVLASEKNGYKIGRSKLAYPTAKTVPGHVKAAQAEPAATK